MIIPNIWENNKFSKPPTSCLYVAISTGIWSVQSPWPVSKNHTWTIRPMSCHSQNGLVNVPTIGDLFHITKTNICWRLTSNSWVMFSWDIYQLLVNIVNHPLFIINCVATLLWLDEQKNMVDWVDGLQGLISPGYKLVQSCWIWILTPKTTNVIGMLTNRGG